MGYTMADAFENVNKFMRGLVVLFVIGVMGALGSMALDYIGLHGVVDFIEWVILGILLLCVFIFICNVIGKIIDISVYIYKKI